MKNYDDPVIAELITLLGRRYTKAANFATFQDILLKGKNSLYTSSESVSTQLGRIRYTAKIYLGINRQGCTRFLFIGEDLYFGVGTWHCDYRVRKLPGWFHSLWLLR